MGPTWGPAGADRTQVGPMVAAWILLSGILVINVPDFIIVHHWQWNNLDGYGQMDHVKVNTYLWLSVTIENIWVHFDVMHYMRWVILLVQTYAMAQYELIANNDTKKIPGVYKRIILKINGNYAEIRAVATKQTGTTFTWHRRKIASYNFP